MIHELQAKYKKANDRLDRARDAKEKAELRVENAYKAIRQVNFFKPLAKALKEYGDFYKYEVTGPFGIGARMNIKLWPTKEAYKTYCNRDTDWREKVTLAYFTEWELNDGKFFLVNRFENTGEYPPNSIGAINGFNHPIISTEGWGLAKLMRAIKEQNPKVEE